MTFKKTCPLCKQEFISFTRGRDYCYSCNPFNISAKNEKKQVIILPISKEEKEELAREQGRKTVEEILREAEEQGTV